MEIPKEWRFNQMTRNFKINNFSLKFSFCDDLIETISQLN